MNISKLILGSEDRFEVISIDRQNESIAINIRSNYTECACPHCSKPSKKVRSYYSRLFTDLPVFGYSCRILLQAKKFQCLSENCPVKIFSERFAEHFEYYQRRTNRLYLLLGDIALQCGGKPGQRLCKLLKIEISDTTLLRLVMKKTIPENLKIVAVGIDYWAVKKRDRYGSILVDLNTNKAIGLLADREEKTICSWLEQHPKVKIVSRDRYGRCQRAATKGTPKARQVADRWHLLNNLGEGVRKLLDRQHVIMRKTRETIAHKHKDQKGQPTETMPTPGRKQELFNKVKSMYDEKIPIRRIARTLRICRNTVRRYIKAGQLPHREYSLPSGFEEQIPYIVLP